MDPAMEMDEVELSAEQFNFDDLEGAIEKFQTDSLIGDLLSRGVNLQEYTEENTQELERLQDMFIDDYCEQAESLCSLYYEITACEETLKAFEKQISDSQHELTSTAERIISMQRDTTVCTTRVQNRKEVSRRLLDVYEALHTCDTFVDALTSSSEVDAEYLNNIRQLDQKIAFLANPELRDSAVQREINPKLEHAAQRAGDQLSRFLQRRFNALAEPNTNIAMQQQAIEAQGQYAYTFLVRYNAPVAEALVDYYVDVMSKVYVKQVCPLAKDARSELIPTHFSPLLPPEYMAQLRAGGAAPSMVRKAASQSLGDKLKMKVQKEMAKKHAGRNAHKFGEPKLADRLGLLKSIVSTPDSLYMDPAALEKVKTHTWLDLIFESLVKLTSDVCAEGKFVNRFYFSIGTNIEVEEVVLRRILKRTFVAVEEWVVFEVNRVADANGLMALMRCVELCKNHVAQSTDPIPLLLLAATFETIHLAAQGRLRVLCLQHGTSIMEAANVQFPKFRAPAKSLAEEISTDPKFEELFHPHPAVVEFAAMTADINCINTVQLAGSRVSDVSDRVVFDDRVTQSIGSLVTEMRKLIKVFGTRHVSLVAMNVFIINNYMYLVRAWNDAGVPSAHPDVVAMAGALKSTIAEYVRQDIEMTQLSRLHEFATKSDEAVADIPPYASESAWQQNLAKINPGELQAVVTTFHKTWQESIQSIHNTVKVCFLNDAHAVDLVLREYVGHVVELNKKLHRVIGCCYQNIEKLQPKMVSHSSVTHELQKRLQKEAERANKEKAAK